jgi:hypothetical protein
MTIHGPPIIEVINLLELEQSNDVFKSVSNDLQKKEFEIFVHSPFTIAIIENQNIEFERRIFAQVPYFFVSINYAAPDKAIQVQAQQIQPVQPVQPIQLIQQQANQIQNDNQNENQN